MYVLNAVFADSIFIAMWTVQFLQTWKRRETELRFLWGNLATFHDILPRSQFKGQIKINWVTGVETEVERGFYTPMAKRMTSWIIIAILGFSTMSCALLAEVVGTWAPKWYNYYDMQAWSTADHSRGALDQRILDACPWYQVESCGKVSWFGHSQFAVCTCILAGQLMLTDCVAL